MIENYIVAKDQDLIGLYVLYWVKLFYPEN